MTQFKKNAGLLLAVAIVSAGTSIATYRWISGHMPGTGMTSTQSANDGYAKPVAFSLTNSQVVETDFTVAAEQAVNGVVHIKSTGKAQAAQGYDPFIERFFGFAPRQQQPQPRVGMGSGVILTPDGYIVTNNHVVEGADELKVTLNDNRSFNARIVGTDPTTDLALLKVEAQELPVIKFGDSDKLKVGEWVLAIGNPFQLNSTVTAGIVSAKARSIGILSGSQPLGLESFIQTDAVVNPGNSGGALVNTAGELVGINTAIYSRTGDYVGYSFAVPSSIVSKVIADLKEFGSVQRALLGVRIGDVNAELSQEKNLSVQDGVYIGGVEDRSAALQAGLQEGDVITAVNGVKVKKTAELQEQIGRYRPGDKVKITYVRGKETKETSATLKNSVGTTEMTKTAKLESLGAAFTPLKEETRRELGLRGGVQVTGVKKGKFADAGIRSGFIILRVNDRPVASPEEMEQLFEAVSKSDSADRVLFIAGIYPNGKSGYYAVPLGE